MIPPSSLIGSGIQMRQVADNLSLFKFTDELQSRLEELLAKHKAGLLTPDEAAEYAGLAELDDIFTFVNSQLVAIAKWFPAKQKELLENELVTAANTVTTQNF